MEDFWTKWFNNNRIVSAICILASIMTVVIFFILVIGSDMFPWWSMVLPFIIAGISFTYNVSEIMP